MTSVVAIFVAIILIIFIEDHVRLKALVTWLTISKMPLVEAIVQTEQGCDLHWYIYLIMALIFGTAF